ncbi:MFS transporter [Acidipropionibacterium virtanenii]|uniref:Major facilitator superfamily (MFS) profile domain-containing protein n=1 Tax=Acidipropionibacterium virtanenii TaxID=2057246 RepID=A0A344UPN2_9ACTN|nr:MFS transporter [Acidipropionibacterium virtanenii]AXE37230.1 hypothetical protein JS278_00032 [Acidipropionibacterium virtanenii]
MPDDPEPLQNPPSAHSPLIGLALPIYVPSIIWATSYGALTAVMVLAALKVGFNPTFASLVAGLSGLAGVLTGPWIGRQTTRFGDRSAFMVGTGSAVGSLLMAVVALGFPGRSWAQALYLTAMLILSVSNNIWSLARQSYVAESVPMRWRARALSMLGGMQRLGQVVGPAVGSAAIAWWSYPGSFWAQIVLAVAALAFVVAFTLPTPAQLSSAEGTEGTTTSAAPARKRDHADRRSTVMLAVSVIGLTIVRANRNVIVPLWGSQLGISPHAINLTFAAGAVMDAVVFYPSGRLSDRFGRRASLIPTLLIMGLGFLGMGLWRSATGFVVCACVIGLGNGFGAGIVMTMGADLSPDVDRSTFLGMWQSVQQAGMTAGPFLVSAMVAGFGVGASVWVTGAVSLLGAVYGLAVVPRAYARMGTDDRGRPLAQASTI